MLYLNANTSCVWIYHCIVTDYSCTSRTVHHFGSELTGRAFTTVLEKRTSCLRRPLFASWTCDLPQLLQNFNLCLCSRILCLFALSTTDITTNFVLSLPQFGFSLNFEYVLTFFIAFLAKIFFWFSIKYFKFFYLPDSHSSLRNFPMVGRLLPPST